MIVLTIISMYVYFYLYHILYCILYFTYMFTVIKLNVSTNKNIAAAAEITRKSCNTYFETINHRNEWIQLATSWKIIENVVSNGSLQNNYNHN